MCIILYFARTNCLVTDSENYRSGAEDVADASLASPPPKPTLPSAPFGHGFSQFAVGGGAMCFSFACVPVEECLAQILPTKSSLFSSYLFKPMIRPQSHLNALSRYYFYSCR